MAIIFSDNIIVKYFDNNQLYKSKIRKIKTHDGPNDFSILWNQLLILWIHNIIFDTKSLKTKFNSKIINYYSKKIINEINFLLYKLLSTNCKTISLYYDTYSISANPYLIQKLKKLIYLIDNLK